MSREYFTVNADADLHQAVLKARKEGKRFGGKLISGTMCYELGARIYLGLEENEEEVIKRDLAELDLQEASINQRKRLRSEQLHMVQVSKAAKMIEATDKNETVQRLAQRILDIWDNVTLFQKRSLIGSLVDIDPRHLNRVKLEAIFPNRYAPKPSDDDAVKIAFNLLDEGEEVGA
jgi:hypothetical protein